MFRLLKLCASLAAFVAIAWFGATVKLGSRTLFGHLRAIAETKESQELVDGTKEAAGPLVDDVKRRIGHGEKSAQSEKGEQEKAKAKEKTAELPPAPPEAPAAQDDFSPSEKRQLRRLLGAAEHHASLK
jgi:hypothetical protein